RPPLPFPKVFQRCFTTTPGRLLLAAGACISLGFRVVRGRLETERSSSATMYEHYRKYGPFKFGRHRLAELVGKHKSRPIPHVQIAAQGVCGEPATVSLVAAAA
ncbi:MAG TPA: hypothetical protein VFG62_26770, partial [Rhodopila sp.]|nr:hypothetical protein [Rhodopila sp.]